MTTLKSLNAVKAVAERLRVPSTAFVDGRGANARSGATLSVHDPARDRVLAELPDGAAEDVDDAVAAARGAFEDGRWARRAPGERKRVLFAFADRIAERAEEFAVLETLQTGKPIADTMAVDIPNTITVIRWYAEALDKLYDDVAPSPADVVATITREPMGVVGAVTPWNFPLMIAAWKFAPALATGNSVVLKPAEQAPLTCIRAAEEAVEAGLPPGVFNVMTGYGETAGAALGRHHDVDALAFTGSAETGKSFLRYAGESNMKRVSLECGGKTPHIVLADAADVDAIAEQVAWGVFFNQGQVCHAGTRLLADRRVRDRLVERVIDVGQRMRLGNPLDPQTQLGTLIDRDQTQAVLGYIDRGRAEGATVATGGERAGNGCFVQPTVFTDVTSDMTIAQDEIFGPVLSVLDVDGAMDAARLGNDTIYGLAAALWTKDIDNAHDLARRLRAGSVWVNCWDGGDITTPFGGYKQSGDGRDKSLQAFDKYLQTKTTWIQIQRRD